jgi:hypothetical protein
VAVMYTDERNIPNSDVHHPTSTQVYDVSKHPGVLDGSYSPERAMQEFMAGWDRDGDSKVSWLEFLDYYRDLSAGVEADDYFELMIRNCWHISGGKGWAENTSNTRVLVTHTDGRQAVHEVSDLQLYFFYKFWLPCPIFRFLASSFNCNSSFEHCNSDSSSSNARTPLCAALCFASLAGLLPRQSGNVLVHSAKLINQFTYQI